MPGRESALAYCKGANSIWKAVNGMREAKSVEMLHVHEVKGWTTGGKIQCWRPQMLREMMGQADACKQ